ncbi:hypothetical protein CISG_07565 [Coccidioides immitis RMSCC 3703]|uniref:Uncharacterized protein n=1 Tax=Coccidioides immitis RMSCC 3703 TaxID=454286 RepID=A0A0J8TYY9_COCIT|nr:hypothetical protein CISG_07565 [Coccidioides immitis RMSCC 3703]
MVHTVDCRSVACPKDLFWLNLLRVSSFCNLIHALDLNSGPVSPFRTIGTIIYDRPCNYVDGAELLQQWFKTVVRIAFRSQDLDASPLTLENTRLRTWPLSKQLVQRVFPLSLSPGAMEIGYSLAYIFRLYVLCIENG